MPNAEKQPPPPIEPGTLLAGKYRTVRTLASGGMGMVLLVRHEVLGQTAAIKVLRPDAVASRGAVERFLREARASANLKSDHIARVFDVGTLENGAPYMLMEHLEGRDLADELRQRRRIPHDEAVDYVLQAISAVAEAHAIGVIHRDLKPSNLFLVSRTDGSRFVKVLDFGISKVMPGVGELSDGAVTTADALLGSPAYMSPEQVKSSRDVDARTDVWSLGVVLHELITGARAFDGETVGSILSQILCEDAPPITTFVRDVPAGLDYVVTRCLERNRDLRYESVLALRDALIPYASARTRLSLPPRASMPPAAPGVITITTGDRARADETTVDVSSSERPGIETTLAVSSERAVDQPDRTEPSVTPPTRRSLLLPLAAAGALLAAAAVWIGTRAAGPAPRPVAAESAPLPPDPAPTPSITVAPTVSVTASAVAPPPASVTTPPSVTLSATSLPSAHPNPPQTPPQPAKRPPTPRATPKSPKVDLDQRD